ncbi:MAG: hypothetical protein RIQ33_793 [Bacteroidota bacterium]|jgi:hypothetical protein
MNPTIKNILAVVVGLVVGGLLNESPIMLGPHIIPPPPGAILTTPEGLKAAMAIMAPKHFLFPFLAHALGTLLGAIIAAKLAASKQLIMAMIVAGCFFIGGATMVAMLPTAPIWFDALDLIVAYFPMGYSGFKLMEKK